MSVKKFVTPLIYALRGRQDKNPLPKKTQLICILTLLAAVSTWLSDRITTDEIATPVPPPATVPDTYMYDLVTTTMGNDGHPEHKLYAETMAHFPDNTTELTHPKLEIFRPNRPQITITARQGRVFGNNHEITLSDNAHLQQSDTTGETTLSISTREVRILVDQRFAETSQPVTIQTRKVALQSVGMTLHFDDNRLLLLNDVHTEIPVARP